MGAVLLVLAAVALVGVVACGSDDREVGAVLDRAFDTSISSAQVAFDAELRVDGVPALEQPVRLRVAGPYRSGRSRTIPAFDWDVSLNGAGQGLTLGLASTGDNVFVSFAGVDYEFGREAVASSNVQIAAARPQSPAQSLRAVGVDARRWLVDPEDRGEETVAGEATTHYGSGLDLGRVLDDLNRVGERAAPQVDRPPPPPLTPDQRAEALSVVREPTFDVYVSKADGGVRRLAVRAPFRVPPERRAQANGATGGVLSLSVQLDRVGEPVRIVAPPDPRPIEDLRRQIGPLLSGPVVP